MSCGSKKHQKFAVAINASQTNYMDYVRSESPSRVSTTSGSRRAPRTGPMPSVPWRDLDRRISLEQHLPLLILLSFAMLAGIQFLLR